VRKQLAGRSHQESSPREFGTDIYTAEWNQRTYDECLRRAEALLFEGKRVIVDASFREEARRREFLSAAARWGVPRLLLACQAEAAIIRQRLAARRGDASDADWATHLAAAERWEQAGPQTQQATHRIETGGSRDDALAAARAVLEQAELAR
jgi:predicted kinase